MKLGKHVRLASQNGTIEEIGINMLHHCALGRSAHTESA